MRTPRVSETEPRTRVRKSDDRRSRVRRRAKKNGAGEHHPYHRTFGRIAREISLRSRRTSHHSVMSFEQNIVEKQFLLLPPGRCGTSFPASLRTAPRPLADERGSSPRPRRDAAVIASAQRAARANSSTTAAARAFCPGAVWKLRGCSPAPRPRAAAPPPRARTARGRLGVGGGPRLAFLCVSGTTRARARGSRPAPAPRRAPTRCPSRPPGRTDGAPGPFQRGLRVHRRGRLGVARLRPEVAARSVADELRRSRARDRRGDGPHRRG